MDVLFAHRDDLHPIDRLHHPCRQTHRVAPGSAGILFYLGSSPKRNVDADDPLPGPLEEVVVGCPPFQPHIAIEQVDRSAKLPSPSGGALACQIIGTACKIEGSLSETV